MVTLCFKNPNLASVGEAALCNALEGTDHTGLAYNLTLLTLMQAGMHAQHRGVSVDLVIRELAMAATESTETPEKGSSDEC